MPLKGIENLYEACCDDKFYEWVFIERSKPNDQRILPGFLCNAPIHYKDDEILTLREDCYDPIQEKDSTWRIASFNEGSRSSRLPHSPYKEFQLEKDDDLALYKCKTRPVVVIKEMICDWRFPYNYSTDFWLCLPIFSYKTRHPQKYVLNDQKLNSPIRFYFPPGVPGLDKEGAGLITGLQCIPEKSLELYKCFCQEGETHMARPVVLREKAFQAIIGHIVKLFPAIDVTGSSKEWYDFFKELVNEEIDKFPI